MDVNTLKKDGFPSSGPQPFVIPPKPEVLALVQRDIPEVLRKVDAWVGWRLEWDRQRQDWTKIPVDLGNGNGKRHASSTNPDTWVSFQTAVSRYQQWDCDGVGLCVTEGWCFIDLDGVLDASGQLRTDLSWASRILNLMHPHSFVEVSPSGRGLHLYTNGKLPPGGRVKHFPEAGEKCGFEFYDKGKYFTVTGRRYAMSGVPAPSAKRLARLHAELFPPAAKGTNGKTDMSGLAGDLDLDDGKLLEKARNAKNGAKFSRLFDHGDCAGYPSQSEADLALCSFLSWWTRGDAAQMDRLFRQSKLYRDKWDRDDYREGVLKKATEGKTDFYEPVAAVDGAVPNLLGQMRGDVGNGERLIALYGDRMRWCPAYRNWLVWDGCRWAKDDGQLARDLAQKTIREYLRQAADKGDQENAKFAASCLNTARVSNCLREAQPHLVIRVESLDQNPDLLNFRNGTVDLRTSQLREHRREDYITKLLHHDYRPEAECPRFEKFLKEVCGKTPENIPFLKRAFGYSLTGRTIEKVVFLLHGQGSNGKSTLLALYLQLLGEYAVLLQIDTLMARDTSSNSQADLADLRGARFVMTSETEEGQRLATGKLKRITQGMGKIKATRKYENPVEFPETHKLWIDANHLPSVQETDNAIWNRLCRIPFRVRFPKERQDPDLQSKLLAEAEGVLAWTVGGAAEWYRDSEERKGLGYPPAVESAANRWRSDSDQVGRFLADRCTLDPDAEVKVNALYTEYVAWCEASGERVSARVNTTGFGRRMSEHGISRASRRIGGRTRRLYRGVDLR